MTALTTRPSIFKVLGKTTRGLDSGWAVFFAGWGFQDLLELN
jgi:hypothetical protein